MNGQIRESDWETLRDLKRLALERLCERVLGEITAVAIATGKSAHERYLDIFQLIDRRNREVADAFDDVRRSNAIVKLATMRAYGLLTDDEFGRFGDETRAVVERILGTSRD